MYTRAALAGVVSLFAVGAISSVVAADDQPVPKKVRALVGTYSGSWTLYGIDDKGAVVKKVAWTDTMKAENPKVKGDRAFVSNSDQMTFDGGGKFKVDGTEGYFLNKDGTLGDYFVETFGQVYRLVKLSDRASAYATPAVDRELGQLGFPKSARGEHVLLKVTSTEAAVETHRITRVTTVTWTDKDEKERTVQFVSLQGFHQRKR
jgi:hypothetical protein